MSGKIFALRDGGELIELTQLPYSDEVFFQTLIEKYPAILAGDQIDPDNPRKWILISREMGVPSEQEGGTHWYLDHLFVDQDAIPTFIEVKRSTDTRIRREVVAQMLDYAANAVQYWPVDLIRTNYEKNAADGNTAILADIGVENEDAFWQSFGVNLRAGRIRLIFVADIIPPSLQRIIEYLNGQMVDTEVLGLEIKQFLSADGLTTLVPNLIGKTVPQKKLWNEESFLGQAAEVNDKASVESCRKLLRTFESLGCYIWWSDAKRGGFVPVYDGTQRYQLCSIYNSYKSTLVEIYFQFMKPPFDDMEYKLKLKSALERIPGMQISDDRLGKRPSFPVNYLNTEENFGFFIDTMRAYLEDIKAYELRI